MSHRTTPSAPTHNRKTELPAKFMTAPDPHRDVDREKTEWQFLAALCDANLPVTSRVEFCRKTQPSAVTDLACRTVFEEILAMTKLEKQYSPQALRDELPARVTRRGFPDLDFDLLFSSGDVDKPELRLARAYEVLLASAVRQKKS
jgi:hypothetical protein